MRIGIHQIRTPKGFSDYRRSFETGVLAGYWEEPAMISFVNPTRYIAYVLGYVKGSELRERINQTADAQTLALHRKLMARHQADAARRLQ